ncbi:MAG: hypothetical protein ACLRMZ_20640 [Blautia marasmi]
MKTEPLNYYVEKGGVWLKDASVVAGLGTIGKNNLLITRVWTEVRLRAMFLSVDLPPPAPVTGIPVRAVICPAGKMSPECF